MISFLLPSIAHLADFRDIAQPGFFRGFPCTITRPGIARPTANPGCNNRSLIGPCLNKNIFPTFFSINSTLISIKSTFSPLFNFFLLRFSDLFLDKIDFNLDKIDFNLDKIEVTNQLFS